MKINLMNYTHEELEVYTKELEDKGYRRFSGHYKNEDFGYWKSFRVYEDEHGDRASKYQISILFYDFSKYENYTGDKPIGTQYEYIGDEEDYISRLDFSLSDQDVDIESFEKLANHFYENVIEGYVKKEFKMRIEEEN